MFPALTGCLLGALLGLRHALEPDHLAAVSTLAAERRGIKASLMLGVFWGTGHTVALLLLAGPLIVLQRQLPPQWALSLELAVAAVVIGLGGRALWMAHRLGPLGPSRAHAHGPHFHQHPGTFNHVHVSSFTLARRPLLLGLMHGAAGSGALTALVLSEMDGPALQFLYLLLFGAGSTLGMGALTLLSGLSLHRVSSKRTQALLMVAAGTLAVVVGTWWGVVSARQLFQRAVNAEAKALHSSASLACASTAAALRKFRFVVS